MGRKDYAIMRIAKLTSNNDFARVLNHNFRGYENTPGVNKELSEFNIKDGPCQDYKSIKENLSLRNKMIEDATGYKVKKNRVRGFEVLFAVNKDFMSNNLNRDEYFKNAIEWCKEVFGEQNYLNSVIHLDEDGSAHMHVMLTCIDKDIDGVNKYCANHFVSGRASLIALQDSWHGKVEYMGLQRGKSAKYTHNYHKSKQEYLKLLEADLKSISKLQPMERDLLAIEGLRSLKEKEKIVNNMKTNEMVKNVDYDKLMEELAFESVDNSLNKEENGLEM